MQTPAEKYLIKKISILLKQNSEKLEPTKILNIGAGKSTVIEEGIKNNFGNNFTCDRMDVVDCSADHPVVNKCFIASVESMPEIQSSQYKIAFANYVLEHVANLDKAALEVSRVVQSSGFFVTSLPNPSAPEFIMSKYTPTKFHQFIKGKGEGSHAHETEYAYKNIKEFISVFEKYFSTVEIKYWSNTFGYLYRFPIINFASKIYDKIINLLNIKLLMGNVCVVFRK